MKKVKFFSQSLLIVFLITTLLFNIIPQVNAWGYNTITPPANSVFYNPQDSSIYEMPNGRTIYIIARYIADSNGDLNIYVYSSNGVLQYSGTKDFHASYRTQRFSLIAIDDDVVLIAWLGDAGPAYRMAVVEFNTQTFAFSTQKDGASRSGQGETGATMSPIFEYGTDIFYFICGAFKTGTGQYESVCQYNANTDTLTENYQAPNNEDLRGNVYGFQDINDDSIVYLISGVHDDATRPRITIWDLDTYTTPPDLIADCGTTNRWTEANTDHLRMITHDAYYSATSDKYFLYFTWGISDTNQQVNAYCLKLRFSNAGISVVTFETQELILASVTVNNGYPTQRVPVYTGYAYSRDEFYLFYESLASGATWICSERKYTITDFETFGTSDMTSQYIGAYGNIKVDGHGWLVYKSVTGTWQSSVKGDYSEVKLYFGLEVETAEYDVTFSYEPVDDPLVTNTRYLFVGKTIMNGKYASCTLNIYFDEILQKTMISTSNGDFSHSLLTQESGIHVLTYAIVSGGTEVYTEDNTLVFTTYEEEEDEIGGLLPAQTLSIILSAIPILSIVLVPAFALYSIIGITGLLAGLIIGVMIGALAGFIPSYMVILLALIIVIAFVYLGRRKISGEE